MTENFIEVPINPTKEMIEAGVDAINDAQDETSDSFNTYRLPADAACAFACWKAMLEKAPRIAIVSTIPPSCRNAIIEECAVAIESKKQKPNEAVGAIWNDALDAAVAAIRALKYGDKLAEIERLQSAIQRLYDALVYVTNVGSGEAKRHALAVLRAHDGDIERERAKALKDKGP